MRIARAWQGFQRRWAFQEGAGAGLAETPDTVLPVVVVGTDHDDGSAVNGVTWSHTAAALFPRLEFRPDGDCWLLGIATTDPDARIRVEILGDALPLTSLAAPSDFLRPEAHAIAGGRDNPFAGGSGMLAIDLAEPLLIPDGQGLSIGGSVAATTLGASIFYRMAGR